MSVQNCSRVAQLAIQASHTAGLQKQAVDYVAAGKTLAKGLKNIWGTKATDYGAKALGAFVTMEEPGRALLKARNPAGWDPDIYKYYTDPEAMQKYYTELGGDSDITRYMANKTLNDTQVSGNLKVKDVNPEQWKSLFNKVVDNTKKDNYGKFYNTIFDTSRPFGSIGDWALRAGKGYGVQALPFLNRHSTDTYRKMKDKLENFKGKTAYSDMVRGGASPIAMAGALVPKGLALTASSAPDILANIADSSKHVTTATSSAAESAGLLKDISTAAKDIMTKDVATAANRGSNATKALEEASKSFGKGTEAFQELTGELSKLKDQAQGSTQLQSLADAADSFSSFMKQMQMYAPAIAAGVGLTGMYALYHRLTASKKKKTKQASTIQSLAKQAAWVSY